MVAHVFTPERTREYLRSLIKNRQLVSLYDSYVSQNILSSRNPNGSFYTQILAQQGEAAAEAALAEWAKERRMGDYASLVEPVVRGMLALASVDKGAAGDHVKLISITSDTMFPHSYQLNGGKMVVLTNCDVPVCSCKQPCGLEIFSPWGRIGIKVVVLSHNADNPIATELSFVLPIRGYDSVASEVRQSGFTVVTISLEGRTNADTLLPGKPDPDFLMKTLGLADGPLPGVTSYGGRSLRRRCGLPRRHRLPGRQTARAGAVLHRSGGGAEFQAHALTDRCDGLIAVSGPASCSGRRRDPDPSVQVVS